MPPFSLTLSRFTPLNLNTPNNLPFSTLPLDFPFPLPTWVVVLSYSRAKILAPQHRNGVKSGSQLKRFHSVLHYAACIAECKRVCSVARSVAQNY